MQKNNLATCLDRPSQPLLANEVGWILVTTHLQIISKIPQYLRKLLQEYKTNSISIYYP